MIEDFQSLTFSLTRKNLKKMVFRELLNRKFAIVSVLMVVGSIIYKNNIDKVYFNLNSIFSEVNELDSNTTNVYAESELAQYDGMVKPTLYLSVLGSIFDVTKGSKHYRKGGSYHYFIGKDGSRALITGNFKDESKDKDHVLDLSCSELFTLQNWRNTFKQKYIEIGVLKGRYYDHNGKETSYLNELNIKINSCEHEKELAKKEELQFPSCNIAWSADEGTKVWCTKTSGGISRNWIGVPRQLFTPGQENPRCVCVKLDQDMSSALFKEYENCPNTSTACNVQIS